MLNWNEIFSCFMILFAVIDIAGSIPVILDIKAKTGNIQPITTTVVAFMMMLLFLMGGETFLSWFGVDVPSFAVAGAFVLFFIALEMLLGVKIFKQKEGLGNVAHIVPLAFPIIAGAGTFSTLIALRAEYDLYTILIALSMNMPLVFIVLRMTGKIEKVLGIAGIAIMEKIFGIILLAISVKLFSSNIQHLFP
jgi:multiple antibiotic resistance protein